MKIGLVTIVSYNYGNRLQNYALQTYLLQMGHQVKTVRNIFGQERRFTLFGRMKRQVYGLIGFWAPYNNRICDGYKKQRFETFNKKYIDFYKPYVTSIDDFKGNEFDMGIVGSDQVWNPNYVSDVEFLKFIPAEKRVMYAVSFGTSRFDNRFMEVLKNEVKSYKGISVRELDSAEKMLELGFEKVQCHIDPTLLLPREQWEKMSSRPKMKIPQNFVLSYFLGTNDSDLLRAQAFCNEKGLEMIIIGPHAQGKAAAINPCEFIWLIEHAKFILTDSFHGVVFSILLHKPFWSFERKEKIEKVSMNSRMTTLLNLLGLEKHLVSSIPENPLEVPDYAKVEEIVAKERKKTKDYFDKVFMK